MGISVTVDGVARVASELRELPKALETNIILRMSQVAHDDIQTGADRHSKSGALFQSVFNRKIEGGRMVGHDAGRAPHALFLVFGTRPHLITPSKKKALRWVSGNGFVFAKSVKHPGYAGDDYVTRAADESVRQFARIVDTAIKEAA